MTSDWLNGKKTYLAAFLLVVWALSGLGLGKLDASSALTVLLEAFGLFGLRHAIGKKG